MVDYEQLDKLNKQTVQKLRSSNDPDTVMEGYRKQRNKILKAGAVVAVSLGTALFIVKKQTGKKIDDLETQLKQTETILQKYKTGYKKVKEQNKTVSNENKKLSRSLQIASAPTVKDKTIVATKLIGEDLEEKGTNFAKNVSVIKKRAKAESEIIANASKDVVNSLSEAVKVCANPTANPIKKVGSVAKGLSNVVGTGKNIVSGKAKAESHEKSKTDIKNDIIKLQRKLSNAKEIYKDTRRSNEDRARASKFIKGATHQLDVLKRTYNSL